jgi:hypothetical protein
VQEQEEEEYQYEDKQGNQILNNSSIQEIIMELVVILEVSKTRLKRLSVISREHFTRVALARTYNAGLIFALLFLLLTTNKYVNYQLICQIPRARG